MEGSLGLEVGVGTEVGIGVGIGVVGTELEVEDSGASVRRALAGLRSLVYHLLDLDRLQGKYSSCRLV